MADIAALDRRVAIQGRLERIQGEDVADRLDDLGQAATAPGSRDMVASPYPTRMRCLTDMEEIKKAKQVLVEKIEFSPIDSMLDAGTGQDTATVAAIRNFRQY